MIGRLSGILIEKTPPILMLDVQGVGYEVHVPMTTFYELPEIEQKVMLHIHHVMRESIQTLYGFNSIQERLFFRTLIKVNGVGPALALTILSGINSEDFISAIENDDVSTLVRLPGIGKKTAERLIVEMRDRINTWPKNDLEKAQQPKNNVNLSLSNSPSNEAISALVSLGYKYADASKMLARLDKENQTSEQLIKAALKNSLS